MNNIDNDPQGISDAAVATGTAAVAAFADRHRLSIPPELREDLARRVLATAGQFPTGRAARHAGSRVAPQVCGQAGMAGPHTLRRPGDPGRVTG